MYAMEQRTKRERESNMKNVKQIAIEQCARLRETARGFRVGQTMTEYALILAAVAIVAYVTYQVMGQDIGSMVNTVDNALNTA
jgi:Flp pilus assembly pilin Flp